MAGVCSNLGISNENTNTADRDTSKMTVPTFVLGDLHFC